jgi:hypothetical protein
MLAEDIRTGPPDMEHLKQKMATYSSLIEDTVASGPKSGI